MRSILYTSKQLRASVQQGALRINLIFLPGM